MSRIRSIHPGLWTDEEFVTLSAFARLLFVGLWNECDDKGTFEWKPLTLKMRILPADNIDVASLLAEITAAGCIRQYEIDGRSYGAVRNFCRFQRPKKPNDVHPATTEILHYVGKEKPSSDEVSEEVPNQFPTSVEIAPQMEDGGWREGEEEEEPPLPPEGKKDRYAFCGKVVRLNRQDYDGFRKRFSAIIDFDAELAALDGWLVGQGEAKQKKWFGSAAPWLNRRHQEAMERARPESKARTTSVPI